MTLSKAIHQPYRPSLNSEWKVLPFVWLIDWVTYLLSKTGQLLELNSHLKIKLEMKIFDSLQF